MHAAMQDIVLQYTYPRLDAEVSKHRNHLLKAPFCVHPKTGRVCVPVDPNHIDDFEPERVPTVAQLLHELNEAKETSEGGEHHSGMSLVFYAVSLFITTSAFLIDWERTSLKPYVEMLDTHALALMDEVRKAKRERGSGTSTRSVRFETC
jgi:DNA primase small subunit